MASLRVAVRVRPLNTREKQVSSKVVIQMRGNTTSVFKPSPARGDKPKDRGKSFSYDFSYDSSDRGSPNFASQEKVFHDLGSNVLKAAFEGFNACVFAYGQTGSGKSYTMMGNTEEKGLIPRICEGLFCEISQRSKTDKVSFHTEVSYLEIYNECVQDLLRKRTAPNHGGGLKVREHPLEGPYVENLTKHLVHNHNDMEELIALGNASRATASTGMNNSSSRSHAIFTISFTQARFDPELPRETVSKIHLVDLAGSERADATRATGTRLKEGANINKSLVTLGSVISALADLNVGGQSAKKRQIFIPYRDSVLTWLLKDSLGGNSVTTMIATISPADVSYSETLSTLRYASRAKNIVNCPTVNEDGSMKVIRELQAEVTRLQKLLDEASQVSCWETSCSVKNKEELHPNEGEEETVALRKEGSGVVLDCQLPHLIVIDEGLPSSGIVLYYLKEGRTVIGSDEASCSQGIVLHGPGLLAEHCVLENRAGTVTLIPQDGALCSVNGSVVSEPCQLTRGAITLLGNQTILRFNHTAKTAQLKDEHQIGLLSTIRLSLTDMLKSSENLSETMLQNPGWMPKKLKHQAVEWQQVQGSLNRHSPDFRKHFQRETVGCHRDIYAAEMVEPRVASSCLSVTGEKLTTAAKSGKPPVPHAHSHFELDADSVRGGVSTRDGPKLERDSCHKSGAGLMSEQPWRKTPNGAGDASYVGEEFWSRDGSLQQTSVLGPGDGCGSKPEGNANEIQGVMADCYKRRPGSSGSSLGSVSHLQSSGGASSTSVLLRTSPESQLNEKPLSSHTGFCPPEETPLESQFSCREMNEAGRLVEAPGVALAAEATAQSSGLSSLVSRVSWMVQDAGRLLWSSPAVLQQVREEGLQPVGARWSSHVVSLIRQSNVLSVVKDSQVFSMVKGSFVFSFFKDSHIFSMVKGLPVIQHFQMEVNQTLQPEEAAQMIQGCIIPDSAQLPALTPTATLDKAEETTRDASPIPEEMQTTSKSISDLQSAEDQASVGSCAKHADKLITDQRPGKHISETEASCASEDKSQQLEKPSTPHNEIEIQNFSQTLITFPDSLLKLQTLPPLRLLDTLQSVMSIPIPNSQNTVALYWLNVAKSSHPEPRPALLILVENGLYTLTSDSGLLILFHHLPLLQLKEMHINFAGHSVRFMGVTEESILGVYTHSQKLTRALCSAILGIIHPGDSRVSQHPLLHGDLTTLSLNWHAHVPDLLLDAGLKVSSQFQKSLAALVYLFHCNIDQGLVSPGEVQLLFFTGVRVSISTGIRTEPLAQFFLTDTHLGLVQEDAVFHPAPHSVAIVPHRPQFHELTLRQRSDVRCVLVHDEDERGAVRLDVILANVRARGHPESVTKAAIPSAHASHSSPHAEVWKLTFSCSSEAACLINHLSNV
ncbi:uncharacterized protein V6R79_006128 [Siganus canaliculatus]